MSSGNVSKSFGASLRLINGKAVYYSAYVPTAKSHRIVEINLLKHMQKYGSNIGYLRAQMRIVILRTAKHAEVNAAPRRIPIWRNCFAQAARKARSFNHGLRCGSELASRCDLQPPKFDLLKAPPGMASFGIYLQSEINSFMLFKFFYPEVFLDWDLSDHDDSEALIALIGYQVRRGTVLETENAVLARYNSVNAVYQYAIHISRRLPRVTGTKGCPFLILHNAFRYKWPDPRFVLSEHFAHVDYVRSVMESHTQYKQKWVQLEKAISRKCFSLPWRDPVGYLMRMFLRPYRGTVRKDWIRPFRHPEHIQRLDSRDIVGHGLA